MARKPKRFAAILRAAVKQYGTLYAVSRDSGVPYQTVHSFYHGKTDLRLANFQTLADFFDLELVPKRATGRK